MTIDFGKNTYQHELSFKFDCISPEWVRETAERLLVEQRLFAGISKEHSTNATTLTQGTGTEDAPARQLRLSANKLVLWFGWHNDYEAWRAWRAEMLSRIFGTLNVPHEFILSLRSQALISVPPGNLRPEAPPELEPLLRFYGRIVPVELMKRPSGGSIWSDAEGRQTLEEWIAPNAAVPGDEEIGFVLRDQSLRGSLAEVARVHTGRFDELFARFQSNFVVLYVKT